ncbi:MAG: hypothetical protein SFU98_09490 [Leptospiraceae bacterium]|nr:hypothetical protein [Leptospiraceae bacterium]
MLKENINNLINKLKTIYQNLHEVSENKTFEKKFALIFFSSSFVIIFYLVFLLSGVNPYSLLNPFSLYDVSLPIIDKRKMVTIYLSDGKNNVFPSKRKVYLENQNLHKRVITLMKEVSEPPFYEVEENLENANLNVNFKKLPSVHFAVNTIWKWKNTLIIDLRSSTLKEEIEQMRVKLENQSYSESSETETGKLGDIQKKDEETKEKLLVQKRTMLNSAMIVIEKTIFANFPEIDSIQFKLDGRTKDFPNLEYKFSTEKKRGQ